jgi:hypothetical protein
MMAWFFVKSLKLWTLPQIEFAPVLCSYVNSQRAAGFFNISESENSQSQFFEKIQNQ